ncbi:hypothetical protein RIF29_38703 [Crotalaria pallida]|uniref:Uncharacterized protein n=1 Tax=Crotalaria pallida TaxID=3830 RepID=A0AAN9E0I0_CROPI
MKEVIRAREMGIKLEVGWNRKGQPIKPNGSKFVSYIGVIARQMVPITCDHWRDAALDVFKNNIWADIQMSFVVDESRQKYVLQKAGDLHRSFRTYLTRHHLRDADGNVNEHPPKKYAHIISEDVWRAFVAKRTEDDSFMKVSKLNQQRAATNRVYPYRKSRKGYAGIEQDMLLQETGSGLTSIQRHILWKAARVNKEGVIDNENVQQVWDKCVRHETLSEGEIQDHGRQDILSKVFNGPEHPGRVRALGFGVTQRDYFEPQKRPKYVDVSEMQRLRETLEKLMCKADHLEKELQQKEAERQPVLACPSAEDSCAHASRTLSEDYPEVAKLKEKGLRNSSDIDIHFKDTVAIATSCCAWAPSEDPEEEEQEGSYTNRKHAPMTEERNVQDAGVQGKEYEGVEEDPDEDPEEDPEEDLEEEEGSDTNGTDTPMTEEHDVLDVGVQGKEYEGVEDLATYSSPSSEMPKKKRVGRGDKGGRFDHRMCVQGKEHEGVEDLATYPSPASERPKRKRVGKGDKRGSVGRRMCVQGKDLKGVEDLVTYPSPSSERPKRKTVGKGDKGGSVGYRMGVQGKDFKGVEDLATCPSPSSERPKRKRVGKGDNGGSVGRRTCQPSDRIIESLNNENNVTTAIIAAPIYPSRSGGKTNTHATYSTAPSTNAPSLADCLDMLKQLPGMGYGSETHILGIRLMQSKSNREIFVLLNDPILQLNWIKSHTLADVSRQ